jgi:hypothetical protein
MSHFIESFVMSFIMTKLSMKSGRATNTGICPGPPGTITNAALVGALPQVLPLVERE